MNVLKNITPLGWIGIIILFNGTLIGGTNYLSDLLLSAVLVKAIVAAASLGNMFLGGLVTMFGTQGSQVKSVLAMDGVEKIDVNGQASATLAKLAVDPAQNKIAPTPAAMDKVTATAAAST